MIASATATRTSCFEHTSTSWFPQVWIRPVPNRIVTGNQRRRGRYFRSARSAKQQAQALFGGIVKEKLGPLWIQQALPTMTGHGLCFYQGSPKIACLDAVCGDVESPTHLVKINASCQPAKIGESVDWLQTHRRIARRQWPKMRAFMLMVDTSPSARAGLCHPEAVGKDFSFQIEALEESFRRDEITVVTIRPRDLVNFAMVKRVADRQVLSLVDELGC